MRQIGGLYRVGATSAVRDCLRRGVRRVGYRQFLKGPPRWLRSSFRPRWVAYYPVKVTPCVLVEITLIEVPQPDGWPRRPETVVRGTRAVGLGAEGIPWKIPGLGGYMTTVAHDRWPITRPSLLLQLRDGRSDDAWGTFVTTYAPL